MPRERSACKTTYTVKPVLRDHCHERPPVLTDHAFSVEGSTFQYNWTCHQRPPVLTDHIFVASGVVFQDRFYCRTKERWCRWVMHGKTNQKKKKKRSAEITLYDQFIINSPKINDWNLPETYLIHHLITFVLKILSTVIFNIAVQIDGRISLGYLLHLGSDTASHCGTLNICKNYQAYTCMWQE